MNPSYLNKYHFIYYSVHAMSFNSVLRAQYGVGLQQQSARLKRFKLKLSSAKNEVLFLERCRHSNLTPKFLCNRCPVKSRRATQLTKNYRLSLLRECLTLARRRLFYATKSKLSEDHYNTLDRITGQAYKSNFIKKKEKLTKKFDLLKKPTLPTASSNANRPSTIKNPILQLQEVPLPPEAVEVLKLGPKFALTPKEIPKMDIVTEVEKAALQLERNGKKEQATNLRHNVTSRTRESPSRGVRCLHEGSQFSPGSPTRDSKQSGGGGGVARRCHAVGFW